MNMPLQINVACLESQYSKCQQFKIVILLLKLDFPVNFVYKDQMLDYVSTVE